MSLAPFSIRGRRSVVFLLALLITVAAGFDAAAQQQSQRQPRGGEEHSPGLDPMIRVAQRASLEYARSAARRAAAYYLGALRNGEYDEAQQWMPTETRRGGERQVDMGRNRLVWEALTIEYFVVEEVRILDERHASARVRWQVDFDQQGYAEALANWQRERSLALGIERGNVDRRMPLVQTMAERAAERLNRIIAQPTVRLQLRPAKPDTRVFPLSHEGWRIEDTFLPPIR